MSVIDLKKTIAICATALSLGIGAAHAAISTDGVTSVTNSVNGQGTGSGDLFFSIVDKTNEVSLALELGIGVQELLANPLAGYSVQNPELQQFIANGDQSAMHWNVAGLNNVGSPNNFDGIFILTTVDPDESAQKFSSRAVHTRAMNFTALYVDHINASLVNGVTQAGVNDDAYWESSIWADGFGEQAGFDNAADLGDMETAGMAIIGFTSTASDSQVIANAELAAAFWSLDPSTGTVSFGTAAPIPLPAAFWLLGSAIAGIFSFKRKS